MLIGSGWHPALFRSEAEALVGPVGFIHPRVVVTTSTDEISLNRLSRSASVYYTHLTLPTILLV